MGSIGLSASAWGTLIITSAIFYGGFIYYTLLAFHIDPKTLPQRFMAMANPEYLMGMWRKDNTTKMIMAGGVVFILILAALLAGFGGYQPPAVVPDDGGDGGEQEPSEYELVSAVVLDETGSGGGKIVDGSAEVPLTIDENCKKLMVNLSCGDGHSMTDYDLVLLDPTGKSIGSSGNAPGEDEHIIIDYTTKTNKTLPAGTYTVEIVFFGGTRATTWHVVATAWYMQEPVAVDADET